LKRIIIDCNNLCYSSFYVFQNLSYQEKKTGVIFGFLQKVYQLAKKFQSTDFIFCWDSRKSYRKLIYPEYKANRDKKKQEATEQEKKDLQMAFDQFSELRKEVLPKLGFNNVFMQVGYEADDLIAKVVQDKDDKYHTIVVSTDQDLYQLLDQCDIWNFKTKKKLNQKFFTEKHSIPCYDWANVKAIAGCSTDNVKGVEGVGEVKAIQYLRDRLPFGKIHERVRSKESKDIIERNLPVVKLPFKGRKKLDLELKENNLSKKQFIDVFVDYGFQSFLKEEALDKWIEVFDL